MGAKEGKEGKEGKEDKDEVYLVDCACGEDIDVCDTGGRVG